MLAFERRASGGYPYYRLATYCPRNACWNDGKRVYNSLADVLAAAKTPGRYRISRITEAARVDLEPFNVPSAVSVSKFVKT